MKYEICTYSFSLIWRRMVISDRVSGFSIILLFLFLSGVLIIEFACDFTFWTANAAFADTDVLFPMFEKLDNVSY